MLERNKEKVSKYNVSKDVESRTYDGIIFDSSIEMRYYKDVILPNIANGTITKYELQKKYILQESFMRNGKRVLPIDYVADFYVEYGDGHSEVIDTKGMADSVAKLKRKMFWAKYPDEELKWISYSKVDGGWIEFEQLQKNRTQRRKAKKEKRENEKN